MHPVIYLWKEVIASAWKNIFRHFRVQMVYNRLKANRNYFEILRAGEITWSGNCGSKSNTSIRLPLRLSTITILAAIKWKRIILLRYVREKKSCYPSRVHILLTSIVELCDSVLFFFFICCWMGIVKIEIQFDERKSHHQCLANMQIVGLARSDLEAITSRNTRAFFLCSHALISQCLLIPSDEDFIGSVSPRLILATALPYTRHYNYCYYFDFMLFH